MIRNCIYLCPASDPTCPQACVERGTDAARATYDQVVSLLARGLSRPATSTAAATTSVTPAGSCIDLVDECTQSMQEGFCLMCVSEALRRRPGRRRDGGPTAGHDGDERRRRMRSPDPIDPTDARSAEIRAARPAGTGIWPDRHTAAASRWCRPSPLLPARPVVPAAPAIPPVPVVPACRSPAAPVVPAAPCAAAARAAAARGAGSAASCRPAGGAGGAARAARAPARRPCRLDRPRRWCPPRRAVPAAPVAAAGPGRAAVGVGAGVTAGERHPHLRRVVVPAFKRDGDQAAADRVKVCPTSSGRVVERRRGRRHVEHPVLPYVRS